MEEAFSGAVIMDDTFKSNEAPMNTMRKAAIDNFRKVIFQRLRGLNVPMVLIGGGQQILFKLNGDIDAKD